MKPKLALVCGSLLFRGYIEVFHGLTDSFDITTFLWPQHDLPNDGIDLPSVRVRPVDHYLPDGWAPTRLLRRQFAKHVGGGFVPDLARQLKGFDIIYSQEAYTNWTRQAIEAKRRYGGKVVVQVVENLPFRRERERHSVEAKNTAYKHGDLFVAQTRMAHDVCILEGAPSDRVRIVPLAVDTQRFKPESKNQQMLNKLGIRDTELVVLYVGRFLWVKGVLDLIEAAARLITQNRNLRFIAVGDGPDKDLMKKYISSLNLSSVFHIHQRVAYDDMPLLMNVADIVVAPSSISEVWEEQFGMVLAESMSCGKPVVSTRTGAIPEVVGDCALLVPCHNPEALSEAILHFVNSPDERTRYGLQARNWVEQNYSISTTAAGMNKLLTALLSH